MISCYWGWDINKKKLVQKVTVKGLCVTAIQYVQILIEDVVPVTSHADVSLNCHCSSSSHYNTGRPYLVATCDLYESRDVACGELKVRILGRSNSKKCTCLVILNKVAVKRWDQVLFQTTRWPNYSVSHSPATWVTLPQETAHVAFALSYKLHQLNAQNTTV